MQRILANVSDYANGKNRYKKTGNISYFRFDKQDVLPDKASGTRSKLLLLLGRLDRGQSDGVDDIVYQRTTGQVVHRFAHTL